MFSDLDCSCGKSLRVYDGMTEIRCPACRQTFRVSSQDAVPILLDTLETERSTGQAANLPRPNSPEIILYGFDPPQPTTPQAQFSYQAVEISSETVPPRPLTPRQQQRQSRWSRDDDDTEPYLVEGEEWGDGPPGKSQEEMWGPDVDLRTDRASPWPSVKKRLRRLGDWPLETHWFECLAYPLRGAPLIAVLAMVLTIATFGLLQVLREDGPLEWVFYFFGCIALTYTCGFLTCVLNAGAHGETRDVHWPGANLRILVESLLAALLSFVAGPVVPATVGLYFWINSGDLAFIDKLILLQLTVVTVGYWLLVFFSAAMSDSWTSLLPGKVFERVRQLGIVKTIAALGFALGIFFFHSMLAIVGVEDHRSAASFFLLMFCWSSLLFWLVFLMRWLGVTMYHKLKPTRQRGSRTENP